MEVINRFKGLDLIECLKNYGQRFVTLYRRQGSRPSPRKRNAKIDKKVFLNDQCKEIEENNRMEKTRDLIKKMRDTKGTFHAKMGSIKDRNGTDLTEAEDIKRWQEYTEELYKKDHDPDNHDGVITHLEPDILDVKSSGP